MKNKKMTAALFAAVLVLPCIAGSREPQKPVSKNPEAQEHIDKAWQAVDEEITTQTVDRAIKHLEKAAELDPDNDQIWIELADEYFMRGDIMPKETDEDYEARAVYFNKGLEAAEKALEIKESVPAHYWVAINDSSRNENASIFSQARMFISVMGHMKYVEEHDPNYRYGGTARYWSAVASRTSDRLARMVGQDPAQNFERIQKAMEENPNYVVNYVYAAEFYHDRGKTEEALDMLDKALKMDPEKMPDEEAYNKLSQKTAREYWKEWTGKEYPKR